MASFNKKYIDLVKSGNCDYNDKEIIEVLTCLKTLTQIVYKTNGEIKGI